MLPVSRQLTVATSPLGSSSSGVGARVAHGTALVSPRRNSRAFSGSAPMGRVVVAPPNASQMSAVPTLVIGSAVPAAASGSMSGPVPAAAGVGLAIGVLGLQTLPAPTMSATPHESLGSSSGSRSASGANGAMLSAACGIASAARATGTAVVLSPARTPRTRAQQKVKPEACKSDSRGELAVHLRSPTPEALAAANAQADKLEERLAQRRSFERTAGSSAAPTASAAALNDTASALMCRDCGSSRGGIPSVREDVGCPVANGFEDRLYVVDDDLAEGEASEATMEESAWVSRSAARLIAQTQECLSVHNQLQRVLIAKAPTPTHRAVEPYSDINCTFASLAKQRANSAASRRRDEDDDKFAEADEELALVEAAALLQLKAGLQEEVAFLSAEAQDLTEEIRRVRGGSDLFGEAVRAGVEHELELLHTRRCDLEGHILRRSHTQSGRDDCTALSQLQVVAPPDTSPGASEAHYWQSGLQQWIAAEGCSPDEMLFHDDGSGDVPGRHTPREIEMAAANMLGGIQRIRHGQDTNAAEPPRQFAQVVHSNNGGLCAGRVSCALRPGGSGNTVLSTS